ncbi:MAG: ferrous iron transport protein A [Thermofilum sp.]|jgi:ferrous iron transport protein A|nr:ferrous iron transport protein A [Thermofilum sp.]
MTVTRRTTLAFAPPGSTVKVVDVSGGYGSLRRLFELGIVPGSLLKVVFNGAGPTVIEKNGTRIAIGRGLAMKVMVEVVSDEKHD